MNFILKLVYRSTYDYIQKSGFLVYYIFILTVLLHEEITEHN